MAAPQIARIDHVVVQQGGGVNELHCRAQGYGSFRKTGTADARTEEQRERSDLLASSPQHVLDGLSDGGTAARGTGGGDEDFARGDSAEHMPPQLGNGAVTALLL